MMFIAKNSYDGMRNVFQMNSNPVRCSSYFHDAMLEDEDENTVCIIHAINALPFNNEHIKCTKIALPVSLADFTINFLMKT